MATEEARTQHHSQCWLQFVIDLYEIYTSDNAMEDRGSLETLSLSDAKETVQLVSFFVVLFFAECMTLVTFTRRCMVPGVCRLRE